MYFLFLSDEGPTLETLDITIHIYRQYTNLFKISISICISTLPTQYVIVCI